VPVSSERPALATILLAELIVLIIKMSQGENNNDIKSFFQHQGKQIEEERTSQTGVSTQEQLDQQINQSIKKREMEKLRTVFYKQLQEHYSTRKYKEQITLGCADRCLTGDSFR